MPMNIKGKYRTFGLLFKLGKGSLLVGAAAVTGVSLWAKHKTCKDTVWASQAFSKSHRNSPGSLQNLVSPFPWDYNWDRRGKKTDAPPQNQLPTTKRHIILIRHGQYDTEGETDAVRNLTETGRIQAAVTGDRLNDLNLPYLRIVSSTMSRARETARLIRQNILVPAINLEFDDILEEGAPIDPIPPMESWQPLPSQFFQDSARIESAFRKYFHRADPDQLEDSYEVIVCHANVIRFFICRALQFPTSGWIRISLANCSLTMVTIHPNGLVVVEMMGDHGHIPVNNVTYH